MSSVASAGSAYGDDLRPMRPGKPPRRTPVLKLRPDADQASPGPGAYNPMLCKSQAQSWTMGNRTARRSALLPHLDSPGPVYQMRSSVNPQTLSRTRNSPRYGFGTSPRLACTSHPTPGPGTYSPRVTHRAQRGELRTRRLDIADGASSARATPRGTFNNSVIDRSLAEVREGPGPMHYTPVKSFVTPNPPAYTMRIGRADEQAVIGTPPPAPACVHAGAATARKPRLVPEACNPCCVLCMCMYSRLERSHRPEASSRA